MAAPGTNAARGVMVAAGPAAKAEPQPSPGTRPVPPALVGALGRAGCRVTSARRAVAGLIAARDGHFTAADLLDDARVGQLGIGRATIFRALDLFTALGLLERLDLPSGDHAYVPCEPRHHHHVVCSTCGRAAEVEDHGLLAALAEIERHTGFAIESHRLELYGRCPGCRGPLAA